MADELARWRSKIALVTGASSGIGRALAEDLGRLGLKVAVSGRRRECLEETAAAIRSAGGEACVLVGDQRVLTTNHRLLEQVKERWGGLDLLINNAGHLGGRSLLHADWDDVQAAVDLNVLAPLACMRAAADLMKGKTEAAIINVSSMAGHRVMPGTPAVYAATKHALRLLTDGFRNEVLAEGMTVKVALLSPGLVDTPWHERAGGLLAEKGAYPFTPLQANDLTAAVRYVLAAPPGVQVCDILLRPSAQPF